MHFPPFGPKFSLCFIWLQLHSKVRIRAYHPPCVILNNRSSSKASPTVSVLFTVYYNFISHLSCKVCELCGLSSKKACIFKMECALEVSSIGQSIAKLVDPGLKTRRNKNPQRLWQKRTKPPRLKSM